MSTVTEDGLKPTIVLVSASELEEEVRKLSDKVNNLVTDSRAQNEELKTEINNIKSLISWLSIARSQGLWKAKTCKHSVNEKCNAWNISDPEKLGIPQEYVSEGENGSKKVLVGKFSEICITCPLYDPKGR
ncbi:hypothetical protein SUSAZ_07155 [Sulfolobus acidocaldarius SUSAZ]|nr:hypothetical protein SUSAZ_07155 [Sulfolobus acidocaldarius SUSAZ]